MNSSRMRTRRPVLVLLLVAAVVAPILGRAPVRAASPTVTRVRVVLERTSDWASIDLLGTRAVGFHLAQASPGATVQRDDDGFTLVGATPAAATVDLVLEVAETAQPAVRVRKGWLADATAEIVRTNTEPAAPVATLHNTLHVSVDNALTKSIDRQTLVGEGLTISKVDARRLVLAFYYPWFTLTTNKTLWRDRPVTAYATDQPAHVDAMVADAVGAGIDGFVVAWDGTDHTAQRFELVLAAAARRSSFRVAPMLEVGLAIRNGRVDLDELTADVARAMAYATRPEFLRSDDGRPVLFVVGSDWMQPSDWLNVRARVQALGVDPYIVVDSANPRFQAQGGYLYNPNRLDRGPLEATYREYVRRLRLESYADPGRPQRLWAATVSPGEDDPLLRPNRIYRARSNGARYDETWSIALASDPEWVLVTTWNEWIEATQIQPGTRSGWRALDQTRGWASTFHR